MPVRVFAAAAALLGADPQFRSDVNNVEEFIAGMIFGLIQKDDLSNIQTCLTDADTLEKQVEEAIADLSKGDLNDLIAGAKILMQIISELPTDLKNCQSMQGDLNRIVAWANQFTDPQVFIQTVTNNVLAHFAVITSDITKATSDFNDAKFYDAGSDVADLLVQSLGQVPDVAPETLPITIW